VCVYVLAAIIKKELASSTTFSEPQAPFALPAGANRAVAGGALTGALSWTGTFHAIGARLLRDYAHQIGLEPTFTIHDREDSADLMNLVRHDLGLSAKESRFPTKATCLAIYSRAVNAEQELAAVLARAFPWCCPWEDELRALFAAYLDAKQRQHVLDYDDLLLYWAQMMCEPAIAEDVPSVASSVSASSDSTTLMPISLNIARTFSICSELTSFIRELIWSWVT